MPKRIARLDEAPFDCLVVESIMNEVEGDGFAKLLISVESRAPVVKIGFEGYHTVLDESQSLSCPGRPEHDIQIAKLRQEHETAVEAARAVHPPKPGAHQYLVSVYEQRQAMPIEVEKKIRELEESREKKEREFERDLETIRSKAGLLGPRMIQLEFGAMLDAHARLLAFRHQRGDWLTGDDLRNWLLCFAAKKIKRYVSRNDAPPRRIVWFDRFQWELSQDETVYSDDELRLRLLERIDEERRETERLRKAYDGGQYALYQPHRREIPEDVRALIWRRDGGKCRKCGAMTDLRFDHVIPVDLGGGSAPENIQLLCERCNSKKGGNLF